MKLVREHINEKFTENSDPIKDMGIGSTVNLYEIALKYSKEVGKDYSTRWSDYYETFLPGKYIEGFFQKSIESRETEYQSELFKNNKKEYKRLKIRRISSYYLKSRDIRYIFVEEINDDTYYVCPDEYYLIYE